MAGPILYSTNPWYAYEIGRKFRSGTFYVWCSEYFDPTKAPAGTASAAIAPSSSPKGIYDTLLGDCEREDIHSSLIEAYKKKFRRLGKEWLADGSLTRGQFDEIISVVNSKSWKIWRPILYVIPEEPIKSSGRLITVPHKSRAAVGPELQIADLKPHEFDAIER